MSAFPHGCNLLAAAASYANGTSRCVPEAGAIRYNINCSDAVFEEAPVVPENVIQEETGVSSGELALASAVKIGECMQDVRHCGAKVARFEGRAHPPPSDGQRKRT